MKPVRLTRIEEPGVVSDAPRLAQRLPVLRLGFRPFYLLGAGLAVFSVLAWVARVQGVLSTAELDVAWHVHEMVLGFAGAVVIGFFLTAARNWTGLWTPRGMPLAAMALLWLGGRVGALLPATPWAALPEGVLWLWLITVLYRLMRRSGATRNLPLLGLLGVLCGAHLAYYAARLHWAPWSALAAAQAALLTLVFLVAVMGGRVIPGFTANAILGLQPRQRPWRDRLTLAATALSFLGWLGGVQGVGAYLCALLALLGAGGMLWRVWDWGGIRTLRLPLLWILHLSYVWIGIGLLLLAQALWTGHNASTALHALAIGALSGMILGMITRTSLGHSGRLLKAGRVEPLCYLAIQGAVLTRLAANLLPDARAALLWLAALLFALAFAGFIVHYAPLLLRARADGKEG